MRTLYTEYLTMLCIGIDRSVGYELIKMLPYTFCDDAAVTLCVLYDYRDDVITLWWRCAGDSHIRCGCRGTESGEE